MKAIYTVGHSNTTMDQFLRLLSRHEINTIVDVRSRPYSRFNPQFNRPELRRGLPAQGLHYEFLGNELGARPEDPACYQDGRALYTRIALTAPFVAGIRQLKQMMQETRVAVLCAEKDPLCCHRAILIARHLHEANVCVMHILEDGALEAHDALLDRLLAELDLPQCDLFRTRNEIIACAYEMQAERIQFAPAPS